MDGNLYHKFQQDLWNKPISVLLEMMFKNF